MRQGQAPRRSSSLPGAEEAYRLLRKQSRSRRNSVVATPQRRRQAATQNEDDEPFNPSRSAQSFNPSRSTRTASRHNGKLVLADFGITGFFPLDKARMTLPEGITDLDLSGNSICDLHADRLRERLPAIRKLNLANNLITSVASLLPLAVLHHLQSLDVRGNPCQPSGGRAVLLALLLVPHLAESRRQANSSVSLSLKPDRSGKGLQRPGSAPQLKEPRLLPLRGEENTRDDRIASMVACARARLSHLRQLGPRARSAAGAEWRPQHVVELQQNCGMFVPAADLYELPISDGVCGSCAAGDAGFFPELTALDGKAISAQLFLLAAGKAGQLLMEGGSSPAHSSSRPRPASGGCDVRRKRGEDAKEYHNRLHGEIAQFRRHMENCGSDQRKVPLHIMSVDDANIEEVPPSLRQDAQPASPPAGRARAHADGALSPKERRELEEEEQEFRAMELELWLNLRQEEAKQSDSTRQSADAAEAGRGAGSAATPRTRAAAEAWEARLEASRAAVAAARSKWLDKFVPSTKHSLDIRAIQKCNWGLRSALDAAPTWDLASSISDACGNPHAAKSCGTVAHFSKIGEVQEHKAQTSKKQGAATSDSGQTVPRRTRNSSISSHASAPSFGGGPANSGLGVEQWIRQLEQDYPEEFMVVEADASPTVLETPLWVLDLHENPRTAKGWHLRQVRLTSGGHLWVGPKRGEQGEATLHLGGQSVMDLQVSRCRRGIETISSLQMLQVYTFRIDLAGARVKRLKYFAAQSSEALDDWVRACRGLMRSAGSQQGSPRRSKSPGRSPPTTPLRDGTTSLVASLARAASNGSTSRSTSPLRPSSPRRARTPG